MAFTPIPQVHTPVPNPNQGRENFNINTQGFIDSLPPVVAGMNNAGAQINQMRDEASDFATSANNSASRALSSADIAAGAARNMGPWSGKTGAVAPPYSVTHNGKIWILQQSLANIASVTPGTNASIWFDYTGSVTGVSVISSQTDTAANLILNTTGWMGYGRSLIITSSSNVLSLPASPDFTNQRLCWTNGSQPQNLPFAFAGYMDRFIFGATSFERLIAHNASNNDTWINTKNSGSWVGWELIGSGGTAPADTTSAMQGFVNLDTPGNGAVNLTLDLSAGRYFYVNLNNTDTAGGFTFSLSNIPASGAVDCVLFIMRPTRKGNIVLPANVKWAAGVVPGLSSAANSVAAIHIWKIPGWANFEAAVNAMSTAP